MLKWQATLRRVVQDVPMVLFGAWIIYKQVYAANPNGYLALIGFGCMFPAARSAIATILSGPGSSSSSPELPSESSSTSRQEHDGKP